MISIDAETKTQETNTTILQTLRKYIMSFISNLLNRTTEEEVTQDESTPVTVGEWFTSKEHYLEFKAAFKNWINRGARCDASHFLLYAILRNRDWKDGWTYPTIPGKQVEHEYKKSAAFNQLKSGYNEKYLLAPFDGTITTAMLKALRENLADIRGK